MEVNIHEKYIKRCIQLARNGLGRTYPNPMVGSVIVHEDRIIGEGWHHKAGEAHAEVNAINSVKETSLLSKATIYVSLEPCSHYGKTPPCSDLIIAKGIKKVVIGTVDPFSEVAGKGVKKLIDAGCEVTVGILEEECQELNKRFFTYHLEDRPYIILKWAQSEDDFLAPTNKAERNPVWITNTYSRQLVHKWRAEEQSIMIGTTTAVTDNPKLNTRLWDGPDPVRVVLDRTGRIPADSALLDGTVKTIILIDSRDFAGTRVKSSNVIYEKIRFDKEITAQICQVLHKYELQSLIIEGGRQTLQTFIDAGLWNEARVFTGKVQLKEGTRIPRFSGELIEELHIEEDNLKIYKK